MVDQLEQYIEDGAAFEIQQQAAISAAAAVPAVKGHEVAAPSMYREYTEDERRASLAAQKRQHSLFLSPKRRAEARAAAARDRAFSLELMSLRIERDQKAKEAAAAASAACIAEFDQRMARMKLAFDAGKPNWREIR